MIFFVFFVIGLIGLFFISKFFVQSLSAFLLRLTRNQRVTVQLLSFLFLPGIIVHELAHAIVASILFVPVGDIEFIPQVRSDGVKLGSVSIGKTDPFRRFIIGIAPVMLGIIVMMAGVFYVFGNSFYMQNVTLIFPSWKPFLLLYIVFQVANTMFSSKKDMEGALGIVVICIIAVIVLYAMGFRFEIVFSEEILAFLQNGMVVLFIPLVINLLGFLLMKVLLRKM